MFNALRSMLSSPANDTGTSNSGGGLWQRKSRPSTATKADAKTQDDDASIASGNATETYDASMAEGKVLKSIENLAQVSASVSDVLSEVKDAIKQAQSNTNIAHTPSATDPTDQTTASEPTSHPTHDNDAHTRTRIVSSSTPFSQRDQNEDTENLAPPSATIPAPTPEPPALLALANSQNVGTEKMSPLLLSPSMPAPALPCASTITVSVLSQTQTQAAKGPEVEAGALARPEVERDLQPRVAPQDAEVPSTSQADEGRKESERVVEVPVAVPIPVSVVASHSLQQLARSSGGAQADETVYITPPASIDALVDAGSEELVAKEGAEEEKEKEKDAEDTENLDARPEIEIEDEVECGAGAEESVLEDSDKENENELRPSQIKARADRPRTPLAVAHEFEVDQFQRTELDKIKVEEGGLEGADVDADEDHVEELADVDVVVPATRDQVEDISESVPQPRVIGITVRAGIIHPLGVRVPTTYADASNLAREHPEIADELLNIPLGAREYPGPFSQATSSNSNTAFSDAGTDIDAPVGIPHSASRPNWALAPGSPLMNQSTGPQEREGGERERVGRTKSRNGRRRRSQRERGGAGMRNGASADNLAEANVRVQNTPSAIVSNAHDTSPRAPHGSVAATRGAEVNSNVDTKEASSSGVTTLEKLSEPFATAEPSTATESSRPLLRTSCASRPAPPPVKPAVADVPAATSPSSPSGTQLQPHARPFTPMRQLQVRTPEETSPGPFTPAGVNLSMLAQFQSQVTDRHVAPSTSARAKLGQQDMAAAVENLIQELQAARVAQAQTEAQAERVKNTPVSDAQTSVNPGSEQQKRAVLSPRSPPFVPGAAATRAIGEQTPGHSPIPASPPHLTTTTSAFASRSSIFGSGPPSDSSSSSHTHGHVQGHKTKWTRDRHGVLRPELHLNTDVRQDLRLGDPHSQSQSPSRSSPQSASAGTKLPSFYRQFIQASPPKPSVQAKPNGATSPPPPPTSATSMKMPVTMGMGMSMGHPSVGGHTNVVQSGPPVSWRPPTGPQMQMFGAGSSAVFVAPDCPLTNMGPPPGGSSSSAAAVAAAILRPTAPAALWVHDAGALPLPPPRHLDLPAQMQMARPHSAPGPAVNFGLAPASAPILVHPGASLQGGFQVGRTGAPGGPLQGGFQAVKPGTSGGKPVFANQASLAARAAGMSTRSDVPINAGPRCPAPAPTLAPAPALAPSKADNGHKSNAKASAPSGGPPVTTLGTAERWPTLDEICAQKGK